MNFWDQICCAHSEEMSFESFFSHMAHANENKKKKNCKKSKIENFEEKKNGLEIWWTLVKGTFLLAPSDRLLSATPRAKTKGFWPGATFPPNLALICLTGSEKTGFMDDGRLRDDSSSAGQYHKAELINYISIVISHECNSTTKYH